MQAYARAQECQPLGQVSDILGFPCDDANVSKVLYDTVRQGGGNDSSLQKGEQASNRVSSGILIFGIIFWTIDS